MPESTVPELDSRLVQLASKVAESGENQQNELNRAEAYRRRVETIADYMHAYPVPEWPRFVLVVGAGLVTAGSTLAAATGFATDADKLAVGVMYGGAALLALYSLIVLRGNQKSRESLYREARHLFWQWAYRAREPFRSLDSQGLGPLP